MSFKIDEGYAFGLGAFETLSVIHGKPILLDYHLERLYEALDFFGIHDHDRPEADEILSWIDTKDMPDNGVLKIIISDKNIVRSYRNNTYTEKDYRRGFMISITPVRRNETSPLVAHKTLNYGDNILEKRRAKAKGIDEPIFLNTRGEVAEGAVSNLFIVKDRQILTPQTDCGLLPGTVRRWIIEHFPVRETILTPQDLKTADELFLTNALMGIMPVTRFEEKTWAIGPITQKLQKAYQTLCFDDLPQTL